MTIRINLLLLLSVMVGFLSPLTTQASADLAADTTFYKFNNAWLEITGEGKDGTFDIATLYIRHFHIKTNAERLLFIPVTVQFTSSSEIPFHILNTWTVSMRDIKGNTLSEVLGTDRKGMTVTSGFIEPGVIDEIYVIYNDREVVETVDLKTLLDLPL